LRLLAIRRLAWLRAVPLLLRRLLAVPLLLSVPLLRLLHLLAVGVLRLAVALLLWRVALRGLLPVGILRLSVPLLRRLTVAVRRLAVRRWLWLAVPLLPLRCGELRLQLRGEARCARHHLRALQRMPASRLLLWLLALRGIPLLGGITRLSGIGRSGRIAAAGGLIHLFLLGVPRTIRASPVPVG
jgi:hypothetical protein